MVAPPSDLHLIHHFLASAAAPYADDSKRLIHHHLLRLVSAYPSLQVKTAPFTRPDGLSVFLLLADGTVPTPFHGVTYNIPVVIWLLDSYPRHAPCVYVNPTRDMIIKRPHPYVSPSGFVSVPFLQNWTCPSSNLVDLVGELSAVFSRDPPLYSQRRPPPPGPPQRFPSPTVAEHGFVAPTLPPHPQPPGPYRAWPYGDRPEDVAEIFRRDVVNKIMEKMARDMAEMRKQRSAEAEGLLSARATLRRREEEIDKGFKEMNDEKDTLEQQLQVILMNTDILEAWLKENDGKKDVSIDFEAENAFECVDSLSEQILECTAADLAIEDVIFSLDNAVQEGIIAFDHYLRNVRLLCREQFFHRAMSAKVRAMQLQSQVATMAAKLQL